MSERTVYACDFCGAAITRDRIRLAFYGTKRGNADLGECCAARTVTDLYAAWNRKHPAVVRASHEASPEGGLART